MSSPRDRDLVEIRIKADLSQPELLAGLENWLHLGLIDEDQVKRLANARLNCPIPEPATTPAGKVSASRESSQLPEPTLSRQESQLPSPPPSPPEKVQNFLSRAWNAFREELSVRWLLFLGIFAVLVASGGLAASQWENFSATAQYGVLWAYTVVFAGVGTAIARQPRSRLTAGALQTIAALLVPINFWAMDALIACKTLVGGLMMAVATITLSWWVLGQSGQRLLFALVFLGSGYLHGGWELANWPILAIYIGAIASTAMIVFFSKGKDSQNAFALSDVCLTVYALLILLGRGIFVTGIPLNTLDLTVAVCGWLLTMHQERQDSIVSRGMEIAGIALLTLAWAFAFQESFPWQATATTGLALEFFWRRLRRSWQYWDLIALFGIGFQGWGLLWRLVPATARSQVVSGIEQGLGLENAPFWLLPAMGFFVYLILFLGIAEWLYRIEQPQLGQLGEGLSLGVGAIFTWLGLASEIPSARSLTLLFYAVALVIVVARRSPTRIRLVYVTRIVAWLAVISSWDWGFPDLTFRSWGAFFLLATAGEWALSTRNRPETDPSPQQAAIGGSWYFGFLFAGLSFVLLAAGGAGNFWGLLWLIAPITLTMVRNYYEPERKRTATAWAIATSFLAQVLTISSLTPRLVGWSVAAVVLPINARYFPYTLVAMLPVGSALALVASPFWHQLEWAGWSLWGAIALIILWSVAYIFSQRSGRQMQLYAVAADYWGIIVAIAVLTIIAGHGLYSVLPILYGVGWQSLWQYPLAAGLTSLALGIHYWQAPRESTGYGLIIAIELTASEMVYLASGSPLQLAWVNLGLGLISLFVTSRLPSQQLTASVQIAPLCFAVVAMIARLGNFTADTGLLTLATSVIGLWVGSRRQRWKIVSYVSLLGIFLAANELVNYQVWQLQPAISDAEQCSIIAAIAIALAWVYRISRHFLQRQQRESIAGLHLREIEMTAHLHWGFAGCLEGIAVLLAAATFDPIPLIGIANSAVFLGYALKQASQHRNHPRVANIWIIAGWFGSELLIAKIVQLTAGNWLVFAAAHIILGLIALAATEVWRRRGDAFSRLPSIEMLPLFWASVGLAARYGHVSAETGWLVLASAIAGLGVGSRRRNWSVISRVALFAVSFGCYELLIYSLLNSESGGLRADVFTLLASVAAGIAVAELGVVYWARSRSRETIWGLPLPTLQTGAHLHWAAGSLLEIIAIVFAVESDPQLTLLAIGVSILLAAYAVIQGRDYRVSSDWWVYAGLVQLIGIAAVARLLWTELAILDPWIAVIACIIALIVLQLPWHSWGWHTAPWHYGAIALPALRVIVTASEIAWFNLFIVAGFYGGLAWRYRQVRWSYGTLGLLIWGIAQLLARFRLDNPLWYAFLAGLPILYIASVDPALRFPGRRPARHWLRLFGSSIIGFAALFYRPELGIAPLIVGLFLVFAGIALQVRAFLFIGTATLILTGIEQVIAFAQLYPFAKWIIGLVIGIVLIAIAAGFESRRERIVSAFQNWSERLQQWD